LGLTSPDLCEYLQSIGERVRGLAAFTAKIIKLDFDLKPDLSRDHEGHQEAQLKAAMIKQ
jgi:hypothetical protein